MIYDLEGNHLNAFKLGIFPRYILADSKGKIFLFNVELESKKIFNTYNEKEKYILSFGEAFRAEKQDFKRISKYWLPLAIFISKDDRIFAVSSFQYVIWEYKNFILKNIYKIKIQKLRVDKNNSKRWRLLYSKRSKAYI